MKKITIVTVCLNVEDSIEATMKSVLEQTYENIEYIIQDGGSVDRTLELVQSYQEKYPNIVLYSEKDSGLYNAMNKAISHASGEYILFLNSKDVLCGVEVIENMEKQLTHDIVLGNVLREKETGIITEKYKDRRQVFFMLLSGRMPCHQIIFTKRKCLEEIGGFREQFSICADFDFMVRCMKMKYSVKTVDIDVSLVDCVTGISSQGENLSEMRKQDDLTIKEFFPFWYQCMRPVKYLKRKWFSK